VCRITARIGATGDDGRVQTLLQSRDDPAKVRDLRRMKTVAAMFLVFAAAVYLACLLLADEPDAGWVGYIKAAAEAGMVGGIADWFAVTALFRRPLGLPIPHTALIRRKKDQLGESLGDFVGENFLAPEVVLGRLDAARIPARAGAWLARPANAERVAAEAAHLAQGMLAVLRDDDVQELIDAMIVRRIGEPEWGPPIGQVLTELLAEDRQLPLIDLLCDRAHEWALGSADTIERVVLRDAPTWSPKFVDLLVGDKIHRELVEFTAKVREDPDHEVRRAMNRFLTDFADDLQHDLGTRAKVERVKTEIMGRKEISQAAEASWRLAKKAIVDAAEDPQSALRRKLVEYAMRIGVRLRDDARSRARVDRWLADATVFVLENYGTEATALISDTVARWDGDEASRKIELQAGRDLQFIRINGTVVGALAGAVIHLVSQLITG